MRGLLALDSKPMLILSKILDLIILNIIFVVCCIPVVTIGAALCALYYAAVKSVRYGHGYVLREFFHSFRQNFWQATATWLLFCLAGGVVGLGIVMVMAYMKGIAGAVLLAIYFAVGIGLISVLTYAIPVLSRFIVKEKELLQTALYLSLMHKRATCGSFLLSLLLIGSVILGWTSVPILLFLMPSLVALLLSYPMEKVMAAYVPEQGETEEETDARERVPWYLQAKVRNGGSGDE